jgi:anti-anti-sigma factor
MDMKRPKYTTVRVGENFAVVRPERRLLGDCETDEFSEIVNQLNDQNISHLVVDLGAIDWISSPGLGALADAHKRFAGRGAHVLLARADKRIHNLLIITKLAMLMDTYPSVDEALAARANLRVPAPALPSA